ncbi:acetyl-CoA carboxylase biotin carboxylase subunit family protein [Pseudonocardia hispaniensis]|uniref:Acetyl-CoA carboxylase biotin carboxylase subunit family protein n=1 Tax=Pseudonocardia hispaniensis TaxID=904933 RepID=A0ABW1IZ01_9PSEU
MPLYLTALNPTDAVTHGLLPAAARLGTEVVLLTDGPEAHRTAYADHPSPPLAVVPAAVRDAAAVAARVHALRRRFGPAEALFSNSDHLQTPTALAAELLDLPAKPWRATQRCKHKFLARRMLAAAGLDTVACAEIGPADDPDEVAAGLPYPAVVKPCEGVASEDVLLVTGADALRDRVAQIRARRPGAALLVEEFLPGTLRTYDTLGDGTALHHLGSWRTALGPPPHFAESRLDWDPVLPQPVQAHLRAQLAALGVGLGACHTEFVVHGDRARIIEVNYRLIGDTMDLVCAELLGFDLFATLIRLHRGEPLPSDLPDPTRLGRHARVDYVLADRAGRLADAPAEGVIELPDGIRLGHRLLRAVGTDAEWHGTNRDYLAVVHGIGPDARRVDAALDRFRATAAWPIESAAVHT